MGVAAVLARVALRACGRAFVLLTVAARAERLRVSPYVYYLK